ncbi:MAG: DNA translocase FtsK [Candidatus Marinimicrobia bacterium]|nr:DNA translocase FtsK [Candidatus Neomarinimicrobiota bacterium]
MSAKRQEITGLLLIGLGILISLSLISYNSLEEPTISKNVVIGNWMGILGVFISHYMIKYTIGAAAFIFPVLLVLWGWWIFARRNFNVMIRFTIYVCLLSLLASVALALPAVKQRIIGSIGFRYSGYVGGVIAKTFVDFLGFYGTAFFLGLLALVTIRGYFSWSFYGPFDKLLNRSAKKRERVKEQKTKPQPDKKSKRKKFLGKPEKIPAVPEPVKREITISQEDIDRPLEPPKPRPAKKKKLAAPDFTIDKAIGNGDIEHVDTLQEEVPRREYLFPTLDYLNLPEDSTQQVSREEMLENARLLENSLETFGVKGRVVHVSPGPVITRYEIEPATGVRVSRIAGLADDLARILQAKRIRIVAPIPGKSVVGIEIPNRHPSIVYLRSIVGSKLFADADSKLTIALGKTTSGEVSTLDLAKMPHLLIAGATGSGKSVCINSIIASILYRAKPDEVKFVLIDPKKLELSVYRALEKYHLITSEDLDEYIITRPDNAIVALRSIEAEMERRYDILAGATVRNIGEYNSKVSNGDLEKEYLPYIVVIIDELADLMMTSAKEVEEPITRLAQMSRAVGIHLIIATQRPSVNVITGVIKANFPARIAFQVASKVDSRTILDINGAEKLLGCGDMLITPPQNPEPVRLHSAYISLDELEKILGHIRKQPKPGEVELPSVQDEQSDDLSGLLNGERDALFYEALRLVVTHQQGSISLLQRRLKIGYSRAARLIDELEAAGIVGPFTGSKARNVLVDETYLEDIDTDQFD